MSGRKLKALALTAIAMNLLIPSQKSDATERITIGPSGAILRGTRSYSGTVITAYQKVYAMNFEIWKPQDLPAGWYATFDGFPVAQIAENRWVYGQMGIDRTIRPTNVLVGSVIPSNVPGLARIAAVWSYGRSTNSPEFMKIQERSCNRMGWLNETYVNTVIAWNTSKPGVWIWLGDRWKSFIPHRGEYTWQMLKRVSPVIAEELRKNHAWYQGGEPSEVADLARQWGMIWAGRVILTSMKSFTDSGGGEHVTSLHESLGHNNNSTPPEPENNGPQWDVD